MPHAAREVKDSPTVSREMYSMSQPAPAARRKGREKEMILDGKN